MSYSIIHKCVLNCYNENLRLIGLYDIILHHCPCEKQLIILRKSDIRYYRHTIIYTKFAYYKAIDQIINYYYIIV